MRRVFFDANVLIAGAASRGGASRGLLILAEARLFRMVVSRQVLDEAERNLRHKVGRGLPVLVELLSHIEPEIVVDPTQDAFARWHSIIEAKDAPILEAAVAAGVDYFVTLNSRDFTPDVAALTGLTILSPRDLMEKIRAILAQGLG